MGMRFLLAIFLICASFPALSQYVIGGIRYICPIGVTWNDPRCIREAADESMPTQSQSSAPVWETRWGAIATDARHGSFGASVGMHNKEKAVKAALSNCRVDGGRDCEVDLTFFNQCAVMILGSKKYEMQGAETIEIATRIGLKSCNAEDTNCRVYYADCSLPERVR